METLMKKMGLFAGFIIVFCLAAAATRQSMNANPDSVKEIADGISVLPFAKGIFTVLNSFMHFSGTFAITSSPFFLVSILILVIQGALQSPLMMLLNALFGPFLFSPYQRQGYSIAGDPNYARAKNKLFSKIWKILGSLMATLVIALFSAWLVGQAFDWVNSQFIIWRILIYVAAIAVALGVMALPFVLQSGGIKSWLLNAMANFAQSCVYAFITNVCIIAVVAGVCAGHSTGQIAATFIVFFVWMIVYTDTDGFFIHHRSLAASY